MCVGKPARVNLEARAAGGRMVAVTLTRNSLYELPTGAEKARPLVLLMFGVENSTRGESVVERRYGTGTVHKLSRLVAGL